jgi:predicted kinase|tara:strand:+ start:311 stop:1105 length:795 start_codon:yes stop_codon:yes gene_type:complete
MNLLELLKKHRLVEGVDDPSTLKCIFMAGGPGSGKSTVARELFDLPSDSSVNQYGLKVINSDNEFEQMLHQMKISTDLSKLSPEEFERLTVGPQSTREKAKQITRKKLDMYRKAKLGLIIDGTGDSIQSIQLKKRVMEQHGYDCYMVFVNTSLQVAMERNAKRPRKIPEDLLTQMWFSCQNNLGHFQNIFGNNFKIVDRTKSGEPIDKSVLRSVIQFLKSPVKNPYGKQWMQNYYKDVKKVDKASQSHDDVELPSIEPMRPRRV